MTADSSLPEIEPVSKAYRLRLAPKRESIPPIRELATSPNMRLDNLAALILEDPIIALELMIEANGTYSGGGAAVSTLEAAVTRLGQEGMTAFLKEMEERHKQFHLTGENLRWYNYFCERARRTGWVAHFLAESLGVSNLQKIHLAASFSCLGEALAVAHMKEAFAVMANQANGSLNRMSYTLVHHYEFDSSTIITRYLDRRGVVRQLNALAAAKGTEDPKQKAQFKMIADAAREMVIVYEKGEWEKYHPRLVLPSRSAIRLLRFTTPDGYPEAYGKAHEFFFKMERADREEKASSEQEKDT